MNLSDFWYDEGMKKTVSALVPSWTGIFVYIILTLVILIINKLETSIFLVTQDAEATESIFNLLNGGFDRFVDAIGSVPFFSTFFTFLVWVLIGCGLYIGVNALIGFFSEAGQVLSAEAGYMHSKNYQKGDFFKVFLLRAAIHMGVLILLILYSFLAFQLLFPTCIELVDQFLLHPATFGGALMLFYAVVGFFVTYHVYVILLRALFLRQRLFTHQELA